MDSLPVVPYFNKFKHLHFGGFYEFSFPLMDQFGFQRPKKALGHCIILAISFSTHTLPSQFMTFKNISEFVTGILWSSPKIVYKKLRAFVKTKAKLIDYKTLDSSYINLPIGIQWLISYFSVLVC